MNIYNELTNALTNTGTRVHSQLASGKVVGGLDTINLPKFRYNEIEKALNAFQSLRSAKNSTKLKGPFLTTPIKNIAEYLGFIAPSVEIKTQERTFYHVEIRMSGSLPSPIPEFGTLRRGCYQVLLLWERPAAQTIGQIMESMNLSGSAPLIIFLGRLTQQQLKEWSDHCRSKQLTALLIDELILCFLATQR